MDIVSFILGFGAGAIAMIVSIVAFVFAELPPRSRHV